MPTRNKITNQLSEAANYIIIDIITIITIIITIIIIINISIIIILRDKGRDSFYIIQGKRCDGASNWFTLDYK